MKTKIVIAFIFVASVAAAQHQHGKVRNPPPPPPPVASVSQLAKDWTFETDANSANVPLHPTQLAGGGWQIAIPRSPGDANPCTGWYPQCVWMGYFTTPYTIPLLVGHSISATFETKKVSGSPAISWETEDGNTCNPGSPAEVRLYFAVKNENDSIPWNRWWYRTSAFPLTPGSGPITLMAPIVPGEWSDADGHLGSDIPTQFAAALKSVGVVGATAGGGCFYGHGVFGVGGTANLVFHSMNVN